MSASSPPPSASSPPPSSSSPPPSSLSGSAHARIEALRQMLATRPDDPRLHFGLAVELLNAGETDAGIEALEGYLNRSDDEGNGWGRLATALESVGRLDEARAAFARGIEAADRHGHPTMADDFRDALEGL